jgi:hypothetical protein
MHLTCEVPRVRGQELEAFRCFVIMTQRRGGVGDGVAVGLGLEGEIEDSVGVGDAVGVGLAVGVGVSEGLGVGVGVGVMSDGVRVEGVGVGEGLGLC